MPVHLAVPDIDLLNIYCVPLCQAWVEEISGTLSKTPHEGPREEDCSSLQIWVRKVSYRRPRLEMIVRLRGIISGEENSTKKKTGHDKQKRGALGSLG